MAWTERVKKLFVGIAICVATVPALADVVVVVSRDSNIDKLTRHQVADIFLGRAVPLVNGMKLVPVDLPEDSTVRQAFYMKLLGKSPAQMRAYWSKIIFTGRGLPPKEVASALKAKEKIAVNRYYVGYVAKETKDSSVKIVYVVD